MSFVYCYMYVLAQREEGKMHRDARRHKKVEDTEINYVDRTG